MSDSFEKPKQLAVCKNDNWCCAKGKREGEKERKLRRLWEERSVLATYSGIQRAGSGLVHDLCHRCAFPCLNRMTAVSNYFCGRLTGMILNLLQGVEGKTWV